MHRVRAAQSRSSEAEIFGSFRKVDGFYHMNLIRNVIFEELFEHAMLFLWLRIDNASREWDNLALSVVFSCQSLSSFSHICFFVCLRKNMCHGEETNLSQLKVNRHSSHD